MEEVYRSVNYFETNDSVRFFPLHPTNPLHFLFFISNDLVNSLEVDFGSRRASGLPPRDKNLARMF